MMRVFLKACCLSLMTFLLILSAGCNPAPIVAPSSESKPAAATNSNRTDEKMPSVTDSADADSATFFTVATYDEASDPVQNLTTTIARAQAENKRILLQVGGEWCGWCKLMSKFMVTNPAVKSHLEKNFLVMKVTYPGVHAEAFLAKYPKIEAYPHVFVLETTGEMLHSQGTGELEQGQGYNEELFLKFLKAWTLP